MSFKKGNLYPVNPSTERATATKLGTSGDSKIIYTNGRTVVIRDIHDLAIATTYTEHAYPASVARISPSGYYCASADTQGNVRIWDTVGDEQILKSEFKVFAGKINDLAWDGESKRIIAVGSGREKFAHVFMMDTGASAGSITGHSKAINAVSIRQQRPFRAVTAGDDNTVAFHHGTPYKFEKTIREHTRFVQDVRFSPSGAHFASAGSDMKVFLYDGSTGNLVAEFKDAHKGGVMACNWSPDSRSLVTSSADSTVKIWDVETQKAVSSWTLGSGVEHQQLGNAWVGQKSIVSLSLSGNLNVFDPSTGDKPTKVIYGTTKAINATALCSKTFFSGSYDGRVAALDLATAVVTLASGEGHTANIVGLASSGDKVFSTGYDDRVREIEVGKKEFSSVSSPVSAQPSNIAAEPGTDFVFVVTAKGIEVIRAGNTLVNIPTNFTPSSVAAAKGLVAVGAADSQVYLYEWDSTQLKEIHAFSNNRTAVTALSFTEDGKLLAAGEGGGKIIAYDLEKKEIAASWIYHTARINSIAWTADGKHCASGSIDSHICVWSVANPTRSIQIRNAMKGGVSGVAWADEKTVVAAGADGCVRTWEIVFHK
ncbi:hypothetical protein BOTBODRAFT_38865 [Botryobasidium botryosum FD-172 SS1]|uniref:Uncharacterized protein n=1 Tax=Botryobasidium botryosum (strain FD-172 SS1) TaxID=930990 RepID=A0A067LW26_BOTB1|nr:hypothetical protein BOTBODRAFT_38865 [Botryobasidium botryosum FD-172 SS1]